MNLTTAIAQTVALLRRHVAAHGVERPTAARLVEFLPMVYRRLLLDGSGMQIPDM